MRRMVLNVLALTFIVPLALGSLVVPVSAQGNSDAAQACQQGGYLAYTDADGSPFKNAGQCTRYAARGGALVPVVVGPNLAISGGQPGRTEDGTVPDDGTVYGTGFTPNTAIVELKLVAQPQGYSGDYPEEVIGGVTDGEGAFVTEATFNFCASNTTNTSNVITVTDAAGVSYTETFMLNCD